MSSSTAKLREEIMALSGVDIMLDNTTFKSTYQIMEELAAKWQDLTDIQQASVTELIAGKRQGNIVSSLMNNFDIAEQALETSLNSAGSAMQEHEKWQQSLEAQLTKLKSAWQSLSQSFMSSDFLKVVLNFVIDLVDGIDKLISRIGTLPTLLGGFSLFAGISQILSAGKAVGNLKSFKGLLSVFKDASKWTQILAKAFPNVANGFKKFTDSLKVAKVLDLTKAFGGAAGTTGLAKALTVLKGGFSGLWTVIASHPILATIAAVGAAIAIYDKFTESAKELKERIEEVTTAYRDEHGELVKLKGDYDTSDANSMISKYGELSKGVNGLGENISLTADEYSEYQSIVDTIAEQIPSLVTGYNSQGDAILSCAGDVDKLAESYRNLIKEQNAEVLENGSDIFKDFRNDLKETSAYYKEQVEYYEDGIQQYKTVEHFDTNHLDELEKLMNLSDKQLEKYLDGLSHDEQVRISDLLGEQGIKRNVLLDGEKGFETTREHIIRALTKDKAEIKKVLDDAAADLNAYAEDMGTVTEAFFSTAFLGGNDELGVGDYSGLSEKMQNVISQATSNLGADFYDDFLSQEDPFEALSERYNNLLNAFKELDAYEANTFETAFDLKTQFNGGDISYGEYVKGIQEAEELINEMGLDEEIASQIKLSLNTEEVTKNYDALKKRLTSDEYGIKMNAKEAEEYLNGLTASEYAVAIDLMMSGEVDLSKFDIDSLREYIKEQANLNEALNFTIAIDVETEGIEAFNTAMSESVSGAGLSSESIATLKSRYADLESEGYNLSAMFEETSNGIHLNRKAVSELEQAYATDKLEETQGHLNTLKGRYDELTKEIDECSDARDRAALYTEQQSIVEKINDLATLAAQYEGLTSAYNEWQSVESAGQERDMYESVISGFENMDDEISRGWYDDGTIEFLELLSGKELNGAPISKLKEEYAKLDDAINKAGYSVRDFFTVNEDGDSTNTGVYNFLETVEAEFDGVIERGKNGNIKSFDFSVVAEKDENGNVIKNGDQVIAEALGISEELVQIMLRAADDAGFVVNLEGAYTQLADLKTEAEAARDTLISLKENGLKSLEGVDVNFNLDAEGKDLVTEQGKAVELLDKFKKDGKIDLSMEGAQEALDIAEYLTIKLDDLTEPKFMQIDTSEIDEELREPVEKIQEIGDLCKEKHLVTLTGDTEEIEEVQKEIDKVAKELESLEDDEKVKVGIDPTWDAKTIADKIEKGEIEIPAELELDVQMSEDLEDMRLMMMNQLGLVSDEEVKLKVGYDIDESIIDELIKTGKDGIVIEFLSNEENAKWFEGLTEGQQEITVELIANGADLDSLTADERTVALEFVTKNQEWFFKLTEGQQRIAIELIGSSVDLEGLTEDQRVVAIEFALKNEKWLDGLEDDERRIAIELAVENPEWFDGLSDDEKEVAIELRAENKEWFDSLDEDEKEVAIRLALENKEEFDKLGEEEKEVVVDLVTDEDALNALEEHGVEIEAFCNIFGVEEVDDLKAKLDSLTDEQILVLAEVLGRIDVEKLQTAVAGLDDKTVEAIAKALGEGDVEGLKTVINGLDDKTVQAIAEALGYSSVEELNGAIENLDPKTVQAIAEALGITDVDSLRNAINRLTSKDVEAVATVDGTDDVNGLKGAIDNLKGKTVTVWAQIKQKASDLWSKLTGGGGVDGTAHASGTAYADGTITKSGRAYKQGDWGTKDSGVALGGEVGPELLVRNGRWHLIGEKGAEFFGYRKDDIIFNADQTKEIFEKGKITHGNGRGRALVSGTAFVGGSGGSGGVGGVGKVSGNAVGSGKSSSSSSKSSSSSSSDDFEETLDWIETKIDRIERAIDQLDQTANSTYKSWSDRNKALVNEISKVGDEIDIQQAAYERYIKEANSVGLSESWATKVRNGEIDIETITNESLADKIKEYQDWYEKAIDCLDAVEELKEKEAELYAQRFENVQSQYDGILQGFEHTQAMLDEYINQAEEKGYIVSKEYYKALIDNEKSMIDELESEQADLIAKRDEAVDSGAITKGSEEWYNMCAEIDSVTQAIEESTTALLEYDNAMREIDWSIFDLIQERISGIAEEADFLIELMSNDKLFDDNGRLTSQGLATMALHGQNYNTYMYQADEYGAEVARLDEQIANDPYDQELINRRNELLELQRESILAAEDEKNAIRDMVEEGIELELDALQELIDKKNEALESERDLYEYQKKVKEQTSEIASLEKQMTAYSGDDSEEAKQKIQQIKVDLEAARQDLQETEYDKLVDDTSALLDTLYNEYELILNQRLDNVDYLLEQVIESINAAASTDGTIASALGSEGAIAIAVSNNATSIKDTLASEAKNVGTTLSSAMNNIWSAGDGNAKSVLTMYGEDFRTKSTTTNATLNSIKTSVNSMVAALNKDAKTKTTANKTSTSAKKDPTKTTTTAKKTQTKKKSGGDGTPKIGDRVKYVSGQYYYDSQGKKPLGSYKKGEYVYITNINKRDWATHGYHISTGKKLGSGDLGWLKLNQLSGYATGKKDFLEDELAYTQEGKKQEFIVRPSDGAILTPIAKGDSVLSASASNNIWNMANSPAEFIKDNLRLDASSIPNSSSVNNAITQNFENITFSMPNVHGYNELLTEMQRDPKFEKLIMAMTLDRVAGKSGLAKGKSIR